MSYKKLSKILDKIVPVAWAYDRDALGITIDSRKVKPGYLFIAYRGAKFDGRDYIDEAIFKGASAIIVEGDACTMVLKHAENVGENGEIRIVPIITIPRLPHLVGIIAAKFYDHPAQSLKMIGVTGTNGKTSCTHFLARALQANGIPCGIIGTIGMGLPDNLSATLNTTPDAISLQEKLAEFRDNGVKAVAMEVSSHGLTQNRIAGIEFDTVVFTNLTRDHLDYHGNMENYYLAKQKLFLHYGVKNAVINYDDEYGRRLLHDLQGSNVSVCAFSIEEKTLGDLNFLRLPFCLAKNLMLNNNGFTADVITSCGEGALRGNLLGRFNVSNLLAVLTVLCVVKIDLPGALAALTTLKPFAGRMQSFGGAQNKQPLVVVDYAHTPDALEKALRALREHCRKGAALWCVFGCGGDRDQGKRPLMGKIAEQLSEHVIITDDNPRTENPQKIVEDILAGLLCPWAVEVEHDRGAAIAHAIDCASVQDVILVAGKGHENYQIIGEEKIPCSDAEIVQNALREIKNNEVIRHNKNTKNTGSS